MKSFDKSGFYRAFLAGLFLFAFLFAEGQTVKFYPNATQINLMDPLVLSVEVKGNPGRFEPVFPNIKGMTGVSTIQETDRRNDIVYYRRYYFASQPGTYSIPSFSYQGADKKFQSTPIKVTVTAPEQGSNPFADLDAIMKKFLNDAFGGPGFGGFFNPGPEMESRIKAPASVKGNKDYFVVVELDKNECFVGEQLLCQIHLFIRGDLQNEVGIYMQGLHTLQSRMNSLGFWQEVIEIEGIEFLPVNVNGERYLASTLYKTILFPLSPGDMPLDSIWLDLLRFPQRAIHDPSEAIMQGPGFRGSKSVKAWADRQILQVKPLPKTLKPNSGAVGNNFHSKASISGDTYKTGEPITLKVKIEGSGFLANARAPIVKLPESIVYAQPTSDYSIEKSSEGYKSANEFTWNFIPLKAGKYNIGPVQFYYFKPSIMWYDSLVVDSIPIEVTGPDISLEALQDSTSDIFYEHAFAEASDRKPVRFPFQVPAVLLIFGALGCAVVWQRWKHRKG